MDKISFQEFKEMCELNLDKKYVNEIVNAIENSDCLFHSGIVMPNLHIASLYKARFENAKKINSLEKELLDDYENTVSVLCNTKSKDLALTTLYKDHYCFTVFYEPDSMVVLGVLKSKHPSSLQKMEEDNTITVQKGLSSGFQKYSKGKLVAEWE